VFILNVCPCVFQLAESGFAQPGIAGSSFINFDILDFPGQIDFFDSSAFDAQEIFSNCGALVFVIDAQEEEHFDEALKKLHATVSKALKVNKNIKFEVFIHKVDGLSDDHKIDRQDRIHMRAEEDLAEARLKDGVHLSFYLTSIYDHRCRRRCRRRHALG
jgi:Ras-related GTP-binding protein C/D